MDRSDHSCGASSFWITPLTTGRHGNGGASDVFDREGRLVDSVLMIDRSDIVLVVEKKRLRK
jgi:hypothetical protein